MVCYWYSTRGTRVCCPVQRNSSAGSGGSFSWESTKDDSTKYSWLFFNLFVYRHLKNRNQRKQRLLPLPTLARERRRYVLDWIYVGEPSVPQTWCSMSVTDVAEAFFHRFCVSVLQKWSKGKNKDKVNNQVLFDKTTYEKLMSEVPKYKMITPSVLADRLRVRDALILPDDPHCCLWYVCLCVRLQINGSLARAAINHLVEEGEIKAIARSHSQYIYTRAVAE